MRVSAAPLGSIARGTAREHNAREIARRIERIRLAVRSTDLCDPDHVLGVRERPYDSKLELIRLRPAALSQELDVARCR
jgi:hypothetical protein